MDGIAGIVYPDVFQMNNLVDPMLKTLKHRGKGEPEIYTYKNIQIGLCSGKFSTNEKKNIVAGIDGSIYNYEDLRKEITSKGYHFQGKSVAEIIVHGYELWGTELFQHLTGEFAIVILDQNKQRILLCRDRIGKKPLYWFQDHNHFIFASELKALLATGAVPQTPAMESLSSYLYFGYIPQDMTPIEGVSKLLPAHYLQFNFDGSKGINSYWSYSSYFEKTNTNPRSKIIKDLDQLLKNSIDSCAPRDQHVCCFLSGSLGSAGIAHYLRGILPPENLCVCSVELIGENDADIRTAKEESDILGIEHKKHSITPETFLDDLVKIVWHLDEPQADPNIVAIWKSAELVSKGVQTVFSGIGSDELFAGHSRYTLAEQKAAYVGSFQLFLNSIRKALIPIFNVLYKPLSYKLVKQARTDPWQYNYLKQNALFDESERLAASTKIDGIFDAEVFLHKFHHINRIKPTVASYLYFDVKTRLADCYLLQLERITAAHNLNWKVPFLDRHIVEYLAGLPEPEYLKESETASYLKSMLKDTFPKSILDRPKRTRKTFLKSWIEGPEVREAFKLLLKGTMVETGLVSKFWLMEKINALGYSPTAFSHLWAILILEIWFRLYINRAISPSAPNVSVFQLLSEPS
ncbi:MAG: Asparagine synthetase [glutamine-hydrolyzing] 1 [Chlamydiae bacterium]|nr:Asparagine synthetase [glutamine-hydrolyzing] 1 [Chlamydiota bacterium]